MLKLSTPTRLDLIGYADKREHLRQELTYTDKKVEFAIRKFKANASWFVRNQGQHAFNARLQAMMKDLKPSLLFEGDWTYTGLMPLVAQLYSDRFERAYNLPEPRLIPWAKEPEFEPRYYQTEAVEKLLEAAEKGPAGVEMATGVGKLFIAVLLLKKLGLQAVVVSPSVNIAEQAYDQLVARFGKAKVGFYGAGKKEYKKLFTVAVGASLTRLIPDSPAWEALSKARVLVFDESHQAPASTLAKVCFGVCANAEYRFFLSGTQMRGDGLDLLLEAITGPMVYKMTVQDGVDQGFLAQPNFRMLWTESNINYSGSDANDQTRAHLYYNDEINKKVAELVNKSVALMDRPTLILVEELEQFTRLLPHLRYEARFAHGGVSADNKSLVPAQYHESDPKKLVQQFNDREFPILVGTSCVATGTDFKAVKCIVYLRGGKSEVEVRQAVGRGTRLVPGKEDFVFIDVGVSNVDTLRRHAEARRKICRDIYPSMQEARF